MKIRLLDYDEFIKAKHLLVYSGKNEKPIRIEGMVMEVDEKICDLLYDNNVRYEKLEN